ncbi:MAG TPA: hypothetical protein PKY12_07300 [Catalimonadaceae bacterium]|nr:hypothetical protein [Catalimonadaceae bacterium]
MNTMLEYFKMILKKVSFDRFLFEKELRKSIARLVPPEVDVLREWCYQNFSTRYRVILDRNFT